jgi:hypothetical protein
MRPLAPRQSGEEEKTVSDAIHGDSKPSDVPNNDHVHEYPSDQPGHGPTASPRLDENRSTSTPRLSAQQSGNPHPEQPLPRQDTADSGVDLTPTSDLDDKEEFMSGGLQDEGDPLIPVYSASPRRIEPVNVRTAEKGRQKRIEAFQNLTEKRENIIALRLRVHEARSSLRHERETLNNRDAQIVQRLRAAIASNALAKQAPLVDDLEDLQRSRDSLQPKEDDYNRLEDQLNREEWELKETELRLYQPSGGAQITLLGDDDVGLFGATFNQTDTSSIISVHSGPVETSSQTKQYLSRKGDANLLREQIAELRAEKSQIVEDEIVRKRIGLVLDEESRSFLDNVDSRIETLLEDLANVEEDVSRLQEALTEKDVMFLSNQFDSERWDISNPFATEDFSSDSPVVAAMESATTELDFWRQDPLLLPIDDPKDDTSEAHPENGNSPPSDINRWLLHRLRRSIPEVRRYKSTEELKHLRLDQERIKDLALEWWYKDESVTDFKSSRNIAALSIDLTAQPTSSYIQRPGASIDLTAQPTSGYVRRPWTRSESALLASEQPLAPGRGEMSPAARFPLRAPLFRSSNVLSLGEARSIDHP